MMCIILIVATVGSVVACCVSWHYVIKTKRLAKEIENRKKQIYETQK